MPHVGQDGLWMQVTPADAIRLRAIAKEHIGSVSQLLREAVNDWLEDEGLPLLADIGRRIPTHCPSGHAYTHDNTEHCQGRKRCKTCQRERMRRRRRLLQSQVNTAAMRLMILGVIALMSAVPAFAQVGPQATITCPAGSVDVFSGSSIQSAINNNAAGTTFCLHGVFAITSSNTPKTGDTFIGEYGAAIDGSGWVTTDDTQAAFRSHLQDIDNITIRNLIIRNMPQRGIHAWKDYSDGWVIENNEIAFNKSGVSLPNSSTLRGNFIHNNTGDSNGGLIPNGGYIVSLAHDVLFENNEISHNGDIQKVVDGTRNITFRGNYIHDNLGPGIWYDGDNVGGLVENNRIEDNRHGVLIEISGATIIRGNTIRRSADSGIFLSTSQGVEVYGNTLENNFRSINLFVNCPSVGGGALGWDLKNNNAHDNTIVVGSQVGVLASSVSGSGTCTSSYTTDVATKNNIFTANRYTVADVSAPIWYWQSSKTWTQWQALPQDANATVSTGTSPAPVPIPTPTTTDISAPVIQDLTVKPVGNSAQRRVHVVASDDVGVTRVDVLLDSLAVASCASSPCDQTVSIPRLGIHVISARAYDATGNVSAPYPGVQTWR